MRRSYKKLCAILINDLSNQLEVDPAELFLEYGLNDYEVKEFYKILK